MSLFRFFAPRAILLISMLTFALPSAANPSRPTDLEIESAIRTLVQLSESESKPGAKQMIGISVLTLTAVLAQVEIGRGGPGTALQDPKMALTRKALVAKGIDVDRALAPMLEQMNAFRCRALAASIKATLASVRVAQESYRAEFDRYDKDLKKVGFVAQKGADFRVEMVRATATDFLARATGTTGDLKGEVWEIDQTGKSKQVKKTCGK